MAKPTHKIMFKSKEFTTKEGEKKAYYIRCGTLFEGDRGPFLIIDSLPLGRASNFFELHPIEEKPPND